MAVALTTEGVVGMGAVGDESIPLSPLLPLVERAREAGLGFMPHAGQSGGPDEVREVVEVLGATRVAHGVAAIGHDDVLGLLAQRDVCLCICPSSNAHTGLHPDYRKLAAAGIPLTINTDDPGMVPATLLGELEIAEKRYGLNREALVAAAWKHRFGPRQAARAG
ncbi:MAG: hypothetical protein ACREOM_14645 [Candidatus Dormibacteraceae bacterium]